MIIGDLRSWRDLIRFKATGSGRLDNGVILNFRFLLRQMILKHGSERAIQASR